MESHGRILRSTSIIGGASLINIVGGLLRQKVAALVLGASGVGLIGIYQNLVTAAAVISAAGLPNAGTREIAAAQAQPDAADIANARRSLLWGTVGLAILGTLVVWLLREPIAMLVLGGSQRASAIGWLSLGVGLAVIASGQVALLTGYRRVGDVARVSVGSTALAALLGAGALGLLGERGIILFVLSLPLCGTLVGYWYARRLPPLPRTRPIVHALWPRWRRMLPLGLSIMAGGVATVVAQLAVRVLVERAAGLEAAGYFHAAATLSLTYLGFLIGAMSTDYYPRLSALTDQPEEEARLVDEQTEVGLLLAGPVLLLMIGTAPWLLHLLYAGEFRAAAEILRWQLLGDVFRIASWPLGFLLLARGHARKFLVAELVPPVLLVGASAVLLPRLGLVASGIAVFLSYIGYFAAVLAFTRSRRSAASIGAFLLLLVAAAVVFAAATAALAAGLVAGFIAAAAFGLRSWTRLKPALRAMLGRKAQGSEQAGA